jgi:hypothetical protein
MEYDPHQQDISASQPKKRLSVTALLTWGIIACLAVAMMGPLAGLRLQTTSAYLAAQSTPESPLPPLDPNSSTPLAGFTVTAWLLPQPTYVESSQLSAQDVVRGTVADQTAYVITYTEQGFNDYCYYWYVQVIQPQMPELQHPHIDLKPGAMIVSFDMAVGDMLERFGFVYELNQDGNQVAFRGIEHDEQMIVVEQGSPFDHHGLIVADLANRVINEMTLHEEINTELTIHQIVITEDGLQILALQK